jgi:hypothetical protein
MAPEPEDLNYFNYFTEIEDHFRQARGTGFFLLSPLDWALIETWKNAGVPLEAALRGIDAAFEKWRGRKRRGQAVNSLAYCAQAVVVEAQALAGLAPPRKKRAEAPFTIEELQNHLANAAQDIRRQAGYEEVAASLDKLLENVQTHYQDLEQLEQRLASLEDKLVAISRARQNDEQLFEARRDLDSQLRAYRGKMSAEQLSMLEKQFLERRLLEQARLSRLSLFYLR